jgi:hypothetical protein
MKEMKKRQSTPVVPDEWVEKMFEGLNYELVDEMGGIDTYRIGKERIHIYHTNYQRGERQTPYFYTITFKKISQQNIDIRKCMMEYLKSISYDGMLFVNDPTGYQMFSFGEMGDKIKKFSKELSARGFRLELDNVGGLFTGQYNRSHRFLPIYFYGDYISFLYPGTPKVYLNKIDEFINTLKKEKEEIEDLKNEIFEIIKKDAKDFKYEITLKTIRAFGKTLKCDVYFDTGNFIFQLEGKTQSVDIEKIREKALERTKKFIEKYRLEALFK